MKLKIIFVLFLCVSFLSVVSAQEDDFDFLFEEAQDVSVEDVISDVQSSGRFGFLGNPYISLSGHFDADLGISLDIEEIHQQYELGFPVFFVPFNAGVLFGNYLYGAVKPGEAFQLYATLYTSVSNRFSIELNSFYFNYIPFGRLFISGGIKSVNWDYTRIFGNTDYYDKSFTGPIYTNVLKDYGSYILSEVRYPWRYGTLDGVVMFNRFSMNTGLREMSYAGSCEFTVPHAAFNMFCRSYGVSENKKPVFGIEGKSSFSGYDEYSQFVVSTDFTSIGYTVLTSGFYKLWDSFDPNFGINLEYQWYRAPGEINDNQHRTALQTGVKRLGPNKNLKSTLEWYHNWSELYGSAKLSFGMSGIINYGSIGTTFAVNYGKGLSFPSLSVTLGISVDVDY